MNKSQLESLPSALELYREMLAGGKNKTLRGLLRKAYREGSANMPPDELERAELLLLVEAVNDNVVLTELGRHVVENALYH